MKQKAGRKRVKLRGKKVRLDSLINLEPALLYNIGIIEDNLRDLHGKTATHNVQDHNVDPSTNADSNF